MATRSKWLKRGKAVGSEQKTGADMQITQNVPTQPESPIAPTPSQTPTAPEADPRIRKGIYLSALIYVEGDLPAAEDFVLPAKSALKAALTEALKSNSSDLTMTLKKVDVQNDVEQSDDKSNDSEGKFQF